MNIMFVLSHSQVYVLEVRWSEGTTTVVFRRYSDFFEFQVCMFIILLFTWQQCTYSEFLG